MEPLIINYLKLEKLNKLREANPRLQGKVVDLQGEVDRYVLDANNSKKIEINNANELRGIEYFLSVRPDWATNEKTLIVAKGKSSIFESVSKLELVKQREVKVLYSNK